MRLILLLSFVLLVNGIRAQERVIPSDKPMLVIGITVSEMRYDYLTRYWDKFGEGGFKRLVSKGVNYRNAHHDYLINESSPGFASLATGAYPDVHGIVSDYWYDRLKNRIIHSIEDDKSRIAGKGPDNMRYSPVNLQVRTLSDELRLSNLFKSKVVSISLQPQAAILSGGHAANSAWWYNPENGEWLTSTYYSDSIPVWAREFNSKNLASVYLKQVWDRALPVESYTSSLADDNPMEKGFGNRKTFPYDLSVLSTMKKKQTDFSLLASVPQGNTYTKDFAISALVGEQLGKDTYTDFLFLNFAAMAGAGEAFHSWSQEMEDFYIRLDREIEFLLNFIESEIGLKNVLVYLTAANARTSEPSYMIEKRIPSGYFNYNAAISLLSSYLNIIYGSGEWIRFYYAQQIYLNRELIEDSRIDYTEFLNRAARFTIQFEGVSNVLTSENLMSNNYTMGIYERMQKSYNQERSGDLLLGLKPGWTEKGIEKEYASSFRFDSHVPMVLFGWKVGRGNVARQVSVTDLMPTIASLLDLSGQSFMQGTVLTEIAE